MDKSIVFLQYGSQFWSYIPFFKAIQQVSIWK